jgi:hypothetical protein
MPPHEAEDVCLPNETENGPSSVHAGRDSINQSSRILPLHIIVAELVQKFAILY